MARKTKEKIASSPQRVLNKSVSESLLESYRGALYKIKTFFDNVNFDGDDVNESIKIANSIVSVGEKLGKNIETLDVLEKKVAAEQDVRGKARGNTKLGLFEDGEE